MKIFDFNIHLTFSTDVTPDVDHLVNKDLMLTENELHVGVAKYAEHFKNFEGANFLLFNQELFNQHLTKDLKFNIPNLKNQQFTWLLDFRNSEIFDYIDIAHKSGVRSIMFNSYIQKIAESDFQRVLSVSKYAAQKGMNICIDGSYGTTKMYIYDNLKLVCYIADHIENAPIIIIHAGSSRIIETWYLASEKKNIWIDTSFSLPIYMGSSVEIDFAFVLQKMNCERILFGSDFPYMGIEESINKHELFFAKHKFKDQDIENIMFNNAQGLFA